MTLDINGSRAGEGFKHGIHSNTGPRPYCHTFNYLLITFITRAYRVRDHSGVIWLHDEEIKVDKSINILIPHLKQYFTTHY